MSKLAMAQEVANYCGLPYWKFNYLRKNNRIPEAVQAGRLYGVPVEMLPALKARLEADGAVPGFKPEVVHAG